VNSTYLRRLRVSDGKVTKPASQAPLISLLPTAKRTVASRIRRLSQQNAKNDQFKANLLTLARRKSVSTTQNVKNDQLKDNLLTLARRKFVSTTQNVNSSNQNA
jgi:small-conductance mechanosensitive channel